MRIGGGAKAPFGIGLVLAAAIVVIGLAVALNARADPVDLQVVDRDTGQALRVWRHDGRLFVAGEPGDRYALRVTNHTGRRVLVVMSVDGVNVLTGATASYDQDGYVFEPYQSYEVTGWRKSTSEVAAFTFAPLHDSYAARTGRPADVGVIGIAVFDERAPTPPPVAYEAPDDFSASRGRDSVVAQRRESLAAPPSAAAPAPYGGFAKAEPLDERLGTGHGARERSEVELVDFERATSYPQFVRQIAYDTRAHLIAAGVIPSWRYEPRHPRPFPENDNGFVPDPPG